MQEIENKVKIKKEWKDYNKWMEDPKFIKETEFKDSYYLTSLCFHLAHFIKNAPVPLLCDKPSKHPYNDSWGIKFSVGSDSIVFDLDTDIYYLDYITLVKRWLYQFYPRYEYTYEIDVAISDDRAYELVSKQGYSLNDVVVMKEKQKVIEVGVIEKEMRKKDQFVLNINDRKAVRITGNKKPLLLKDFMKELRAIKDQNERRNYIMENSREFSEYREYKETIEVFYSENQMMNFFIINFPILKNYEIVKVKDLLYRCDNYLIKFNSDTIMADCLAYYYTTKGE